MPPQSYVLSGLVFRKSLANEMSNYSTWKYFVKEGCSYTEPSIRLPSAVLSGNEAKSTYESIINTEPSNKPEENPETNTTRSHAKSVRPFNVYKFLTAAQENDDLTLKQLIFGNETRIDSTDSYGWTALMCAAQAGSTDCVEFLMKNGANVKITDKNGCTALDFAFNVGNIRIAKILKGNCITRTESKKTPNGGYCELCREATEDIDAHYLSIVHNFNQRKSNTKTFYGLPESNRGYQLMLKTGWDTEWGLGPHGLGEKFPVKTSLKRNKKGFGLDKTKARITHFKPNDATAVESKLAKKTTLFKHTMHSDRRREKRMEIQFRNEFL